MARKVINVVTGGSSNIKYYDVSSIEPTFAYTLAIYAFLVKFIFNQNIIIGCSGVLLEIGAEVNYLAIALDLDAKVTNLSSGEISTVGDILTDAGLLDGLSEITEEQFYDLTLPTE